MKRIITSLLFILIFTSLLCAQDKREVVIKVETPGLPANSIVYISGNATKLGSWNPSAVAMDKMSDSIWIRKLDFNIGDILEFKFTLGSWDKERLNDDGSTPSNTILKVVDDTTVTFVINKWSNKVNQEKEVHGQITGKVEYIRGLKGKGILPRDVIVWLPPGYEKNKNERYPVLYMHDGQNIIDPATSSFGYDWRVDEVADSLIKAGKIKKIIIVGIYNTSERGAEYGGSKSDAYMNFIINKLKPIIDKKYRTKPGRNNTAVGGSSLGGTIAFKMVWEHPEIFSEAACISPAFHIDEYDCLAEVKQAAKKKPVRLYIDIGGIGLEERLQPGVDEMLALLKAKGYKEGKDLEYFKDPTAEHNEQNWAKRVGGWMEFLFPQ